MLCVLIFLVTSAQCAEQQRPKKLVFSHVNHPVIIHQLIPMIREVYAGLGINTVFIEQPSDRNLKAINKGLLDGDVVYSDLLLRGYDNLVIVQPPLVTSVFVLLCQPEARCEQQVLGDENTLVVSTDASYHGVNSWYGDSVKAEFYHINNLSIIPDLIAEKRFQYGIYIFSAEQIAQGTQNKVNYHELFRTNSYHILNPRYAFLKDEVGRGIIRMLEQKKAENMVQRVE